MARGEAAAASDLYLSSEMANRNARAASEMRTASSRQAMSSTAASRQQLISSSMASSRQEASSSRQEALSQRTVRVIILFQSVAKIHFLSNKVDMVGSYLVDLVYLND